MQSQPLETVSWYFTAERMPALMPNAIPKTNPAVAVVSGEGKPVALKSEACNIEPKANALKALEFGAHAHVNKNNANSGGCIAVQKERSGGGVLHGPKQPWACFCCCHYLLLAFQHPSAP